MHNILRVLVNIILVCAALRHQEQQNIEHVTEKCTRNRIRGRMLEEVHKQEDKREK